MKPPTLVLSVGISKATNKTGLIDSIDLAAQYDRKIIVEAALDAREIECAVIGNDEPRASLPGEYVVYDEAARFLDYTEKYAETGHVKFVVPAPLSKSMISNPTNGLQVFKSSTAPAAEWTFSYARRQNCCNDLILAGAA